jgi:exo-1,4-beta-D-glucosaminidase
MSRTLSVFTEALNRRYGPSNSAEEYSMKSQVQAYESHRAMMEAYGRSKYTSTGIIQWMLNNAWPSMIWHMYDWYLRPAGSYFGVKKACEPLHVQYSYDDRSVVVVNSYYQPFDAKVSAKVYNLDMTEKFSKDAQVSVGPDSSTRVFTLPSISGLSATYFVSLTLESGGQIASRNFYWLSTREETLDWPREEQDTSGQYDISTWTPTKDYADYTAMNLLPKINVEATAKTNNDDEERTTTVTLHNPTSVLAFDVHLKVNRGTSRRVSREAQEDPEILPVLWQDNYFSLLPGETRQITARYHVKIESGATPSVELEGWNVNHMIVQAKP